MKAVRSVMNVMIFVLILGLSGCGGDAGSSGQEQPQSEIPGGEQPQSEVPGEEEVGDALYPGAPSISLRTEVSGSVNTDGSSSSTYKLSLTAAGTYTVYIEMLEGTTDEDYHATSLQVFDAYGTELLNLYKEDGLDKAGDWDRGTFEALAAGDYYILIEREGNELGYYKFSVHPSLANGLVQDSNGELNDELSMAKPITFEEAMAGIDGSLSITAVTDSDDWYELSLSAAGTYVVYLKMAENLEEGQYEDATVRVYAGDGTALVVSQFEYDRYTPARIWSRNIFNAQTAGKHYIRITHDSDSKVNYNFSVQPSIANGLVQDDDNELNDEKSMATPITLQEASAEINGTLNVTDITDSDDWYQLSLTAPGTYTAYIEMLEGTFDATDNSEHTVVFHLYDEAGTKLLKMFKVFNLNAPGEWDRMPFDITVAGSYYIQIENQSGLAAHYKFSVQPSIANGLVQDDANERNDEKSMATPITLAEASAEINGSLGVISVTDSDDWYRLPLTAAGIYTMYGEVLDGTEEVLYVETSMQVYAEDGTELVNLYTYNDLDKAGDWSRKVFEAAAPGDYYIRIHRDRNISYYRFSVHPSIANGLVQDADNERNDVKSMATPITLAEATAEINGTLNITNTMDTYDWYQLPLTAGSYTFFGEMLSGSQASINNMIDLTIYNEDGSTLTRLYTQGVLDEVGETNSKMFDVAVDGNYYVRIMRESNLPTTYKFSVTPYSSKGKP